MKVIPEPQRLKIHFRYKSRNIKPHGHISEHCRGSDYENIQEKILLLFHKHKHQHNAGQLTGRVLGYCVFKLLHSGEEPGNIKHCGDQAHGQHKVNDLILARESDERKPDRDAGG